LCKSLHIDCESAIPRRCKSHILKDSFDFVLVECWPGTSCAKTGRNSSQSILNSGSVSSLWDPGFGEEDPKLRYKPTILGVCRTVGEKPLDSGDPGGSRTPNPQIRSLMLYPVELRGRYEICGREAVYTCARVLSMP
jgi:hypothetical protein